MNDKSRKKYVYLCIILTIIFIFCYIFVFGFFYPGIFRHRPEEMTGISKFIWAYGEHIFAIAFSVFAFIGTLGMKNTYIRCICILLAALLGYVILIPLLLMIMILGCTLFGCAM